MAENPFESPCKFTTSQTSVAQQKFHCSTNTLGHLRDAHINKSEGGHIGTHRGSSTGENRECPSFHGWVPNPSKCSSNGGIRMWPLYHSWQRVRAAAVPQHLAPFPECSQNPTATAEMLLQPPAVPAATGNQVAAMQACKPASPSPTIFLHVVVVPWDPGNMHQVKEPTTLEVTPGTTVTPTHPTTTLEVQVMQVRQNENLYYSLIDWKTKEKPININLLNR